MAENNEIKKLIFIHCYQQIEYRIQVDVDFLTYSICLLDPEATNYCFIDTLQPNFDLSQAKKLFDKFVKIMHFI